MDPVLLSIVIGALVALLVIGIGVGIGVSRRRALGSTPRPEVGPGGGGETGGTGTATLERPDLGAESGVAVEDRLETPEAPRTRLRRLRERLAGQNNLLARGLLIVDPYHQILIGAQRVALQHSQAVEGGDLLLVVG